jgi:hypothetical protein
VRVRCALLQTAIFTGMEPRSDDGNDLVLIRHARSTLAAATAAIRLGRLLVGLDDIGITLTLIAFFGIRCWPIYRWFFQPPGPGGAVLCCEPVRPR